MCYPWYLALHWLSIFMKICNSFNVITIYLFNYCFLLKNTDCVQEMYIAAVRLTIYLHKQLMLSDGVLCLMFCGCTVVVPMKPTQQSKATVLNSHMESPNKKCCVLCKGMSESCLTVQTNDSQLVSRDPKVGRGSMFSRLQAFAYQKKKKETI